MSLREIIWGKNPSPYSKPAPLHLRVLETREVERVIKWSFVDGQASVAEKKTNAIVAITDGKSVAKLTIYEEYKHKATKGRSFLLKNYSLTGSSPAYILINRDTQFYRSSPVEATEELCQEGKNLLFPPSPLTPLTDAGHRGFSTVEGVVAELSEIKKVLVGRDYVPLRTIVIKQGPQSAQVNMWREAAIEELSPGQRVRMTHLCHSKEKGILQTGTFTTVETIKQEVESVTAEVRGVGEAKQGIHMLDLSDGSELQITSELWEPLDHLLDQGPLRVTVQKIGQRALSIKVAAEPTL